MIYLDTHVVVWLYAGLTTRLTPTARDLLNASDLAISPMVFSSCSICMRLDVQRNQAALSFRISPNASVCASMRSPSSTLLLWLSSRRGLAIPLTELSSGKQRCTRQQWSPRTVLCASIIPTLFGLKLSPHPLMPRLAARLPVSSARAALAGRRNCHHVQCTPRGAHPSSVAATPYRLSRRPRRPVGWRSVLVACGQGEEGITQIQQGLAAYRATGVARDRPYYLAILAEASIQAGRSAAGLEALGEALATLATSGGTGGKRSCIDLKANSFWRIQMQSQSGSRQQSTSVRPAPWPVVSRPSPSNCGWP